MGPTHGRRFPLGSVAIAATLVSIVDATPIAAQPLVRVRAETRIELAPRRSGDRLVVDGALRDDLGSALVDRDVTIELHEASRIGVLRSRSVVRTTTGGAFATTFEVPLGTWWVSARFGGDDHHAPQEVSREVLLAREHVRLDVQIEGGPTMDLDVPDHAVHVRAHAGDAGASGLEVMILENGRELARGATDDHGEVTFTIRSDDLGPPSATRLVVRSAPDAHRADAQTEVPIVRFRATRLALESSRTEVRPGETVRLAGALTTSRGPLSRKAVGLWAIAPGLPERHLATVLTDDAGAFAATLADDDLGVLDGEVVARFEADAPWWGSSSSNPVALRVEAPGGTPWRWLVLSIALSATLFLLAGRRRRDPGTGRASLPVRAPAIELAARRSLIPDATDIAGRVIDARSESPVSGAIVRARRGDALAAETESDGEGRFALRGLGAGGLSIEIDARGYEPARHRVVLPHRGEWSQVVIRLRSLRELAWEPLRPIAARLLPSPDLWGIWTGRDLEAAARARVPDALGLSALVCSIERACYAPEPPTASDLDAIRAAADKVERELATVAAPREALARPAREA